MTLEEQAALRDYLVATNAALGAGRELLDALIAQTEFMDRFLKVSGMEPRPLLRLVPDPSASPQSPHE